MDLTSYAELAVRLVNTANGAGSDGDQLGTTASLQELVADYPHLRGPSTHHDLDALRILRAELTAIFTAAEERDYPDAAQRLNALLVQYPLRPVLVRHDRSRWHLHLDPSGSVADRYGAGAVASLAAIAAQFGLSHLGMCAFPGCRCAFAGTGPGRAGRYCTKHCASKGSVTALRTHSRAAARGSASAAG